MRFKKHPSRFWILWFGCWGFRMKISRELVLLSMPQEKVLCEDAGILGGSSPETFFPVSENQICGLIFFAKKRKNDKGGNLKKLLVCLQAQKMEAQSLQGHLALITFQLHVAQQIRLLLQDGNSPLSNWIQNLQQVGSSAPRAKCFNDKVHAHNDGARKTASSEAKNSAKCHNGTVLIPCGSKASYGEASALCTQVALNNEVVLAANGGAILPDGEAKAELPVATVNMTNRGHDQCRPKERCRGLSLNLSFEHSDYSSGMGQVFVGQYSAYQSTCFRVVPNTYPTGGSTFPDHLGISFFGLTMKKRQVVTLLPALSVQSKRALHQPICWTITKNFLVA